MVETEGGDEEIRVCRTEFGINLENDYSLIIHFKISSEFVTYLFYLFPTIIYVFLTIDVRITYFLH